MKPSLFLLFFFTALHCSSAPVTIKGTASSYAGKTLSFYTYSNSISGKETVLSTFKIQSNGNFETTFDIPETQYIFSHAGIFFLYLFVEPGKDYTIKLPERTEKKPADKLNPFFEEIKVHLILEAADSNELNSLIRTFDDYFDPLYSRYALTLYHKQPVNNLDSTLQSIETRFSQTQNEYFKAYYTYRIGLIKFLSTKFKSRNISDNYFLNKPVLYDNPAYMELFNKIYDKYFVFFGRTKTGRIIYDDINKAKSLTRLKATLGQDKVLSNDTLKELVILKGIHDGCYQMDFTREALLGILDSLTTTSTISKHTQVAKEIRYKITRLLPGYTPPEFNLYNQDSVLTSLSNFKGSFVYLVFATTQNYVCLKEFELIRKFQQKHPGLMKVVVVSADEKLSDMRYYVKKSQLNWTFLHYGNHAEILKDYDIRTIPTSFFIDKEGKLALSPAPLMSENFEAYIYNYLKSKKLL